MKLIESIDALTNASDHLRYSRDLIHRMEMSEDLRGGLEIKLDTISQRLNDQNLYVVVVGRANTGKTTFINALVRDQILKAGALEMTTAAATFLKYNDKIGVKARYKAANSYQFSPMHSLSPKENALEAEMFSESELAGSKQIEVFQSDEPITIPDMPGVNGLSVRDFINAITTDNAIAQNLISLFIYYHSAFLKQGIVVIDAPGYNVKNENHLKAITKAIRKSDLTIFITPAERALTQDDVNTFGQSEFLGDFLHRCIFLITRMDHAVNSEPKMSREEVEKLIYDNTLSRLQASLAKFNLPHEPPLFFCAAQALFDGMNGEPSVFKNAEERDYWKLQFEELKLKLVDQMAINRSLIISESILRLLADLFDTINTHLAQRWEGYNQKKATAENIITDINVFCNDQRKKAQGQLKDLWHDEVYKVEVDIDKERDKTINQVSNAIYSASNMEDLQRAAGESTRNIVDSSRARIERSVYKAIGNIDQKALAFHLQFENEFKLLYNQLHALAKKTEQQAFGQYSTPTASGSASLSVGSSFEDETPGKVFGGALIGGIIGSIIPGIGTIFGTIVGGIIGSFFGPSLDERKSEIWNEIRPKLVNYFAERKSEVPASIKRHGTSVRENMIARIDDYARIYKKDVDRIRSAQIKELESLNVIQGSLEKDMAEIRNRQEQIYKTQVRLKKYSQNK